MFSKEPIPAGCYLIALLAFSPAAAETWTIDSREEWNGAVAESEGVALNDGTVSASTDTGTLRSVIRTFEEKRSPQSVVVTQVPTWENWEPVENIGPSNLQDAPVFLSRGPGDYWIFGRYGGTKRRGKGKAKAKAATGPFVPEEATLEGFDDVPLKTTPFPNQYDAPGAEQPRLGGYHAWQSRDMVNWVHHGAVSEQFSRWVTTAEFADGTLYLYYDYPNDQDPHVYVDDDLTDGLPGENRGMALRDPSHGSDCGVIRDLDGKFHIIFEDWSPINASKRSWDSPLAGHAVSENGIDGFRILEPAVDNRTKPTGEIKTYTHPHWAKEDPDNYPTNVAEYEVHEPEQEAYGDWAAIAVGGQYYLFADYDPAGGHNMSVCWFTSDEIGKPFTFCGTVGEGHPDPDIGFAEGKFYLITQQSTDWTSPGPWVESVEIRVGVDTDGDGALDVRTDWTPVRETYDHTPGFVKQVTTTPASLDLSGLPAGFGFGFEMRLTDTTENRSRPVVESVRWEWE